MEYKTSLLFMFILNGVWSSNCGTEDLRTLFDGGVGQCDTQETWILSRPSETVDGITDISDILTPSSVASCITSRIIPMNGGDLIEVNVYAKSFAKEDYVTVTIYEAAENQVVGKATLSAEKDDFKNGQNVLTIILDGPKKFNGYVMLMGKAAESSILLVKSVCFASVALEDIIQRQEYVIKLTSNYRAPDIYLLQTKSVLEGLVHPNVTADAISNEIDMTDSAPNVTADVIRNEIDMTDSAPNVTADAIRNEIDMTDSAPNVTADAIRNEIDMTDSTPKNKVDRFIDFEDFWTPLTISVAAGVAVVILALMAWGCFALGKSRGAKKEPEIVYEDVNNIPKPYLVPRVRGVFTESVTGSSYGERNNNIYSV